MHELVTLVHRRAQRRAPAQQVAHAHVGDVGEVLLGVDDAVEVAAIGNVDPELAQPRRIDLEIGGVEEARHVGEPDIVHVLAVHRVLGHHLAGGHVEIHHARRLRGHQPVLDRHGHGADGAVPAHVEAARGFDEQDRDIAILARRRIEDRAAHHVMAARLEHQPFADPIVVLEEIGAPLHHRVALEQRAAAGDEADRVAAGVTIDAGEDMPGHGKARSRSVAERRG